MKIAKIDPTIVSVPYREREHSTRVQRDGVTDVLVRIETDDGLVGWGESCSGANVESIAEAVKAAIPIVVGRNPWNTEAIAADFFGAGLWDMRPMTMVFVTHSIEEAVLMGDRVVVLKGRPSTVFETIEVDLPRPRARQTLGLARFNELREHVWATLMDEARRAEFSISL